MKIDYRFGLPNKNELFQLYEKLGWNSDLKLSSSDIYQAMENSYFVVGAYICNVLVRTGRIISDGKIYAYLCGLGVLEEFRNQGIANRINEILLEKCKDDKLQPQFFCDEKLQAFYESKGYKSFAIGMKYDEYKG